METKQWTVIVDYRDDSRSTYMTTVTAENAQEAGDKARLECAREYLSMPGEPPVMPEGWGLSTVEECYAQQAGEYGIIAVILGEHLDMYPHND